MDGYVGAGTVLFDRSLLMEAQSVSVSINSNNRRVYTMRKGLAGRSKGPTEAEIQITTALPDDGLEHEYLEKCVVNADVSIVVVFAGRRYQYDGWIDTASHEQNQDAPATLSFTVISGPPQIL